MLKVVVLNHQSLHILMCLWDLEESVRPPEVIGPGGSVSMDVFLMEMLAFVRTQASIRVTKGVRTGMCMRTRIGTCTVMRVGMYVDVCSDMRMGPCTVPTEERRLVPSSQSRGRAFGPRT